MLKGIIKEIVGNVSVKDHNGEQRILTIQDSINPGDTVMTNSSVDKISFKFNDVKINISGKDTLKIDQSVVVAESFDGESNIQPSSIQDILNLITNYSFVSDISDTISDDRVLDFNEVERLHQVAKEPEMASGDVLAKVSPSDLLIDYEKSEIVLRDNDGLQNLAVNAGKISQNNPASEIDATFSIKIDTDIQTDFS